MNTFKIKQFFSDKYADFRRYFFDKFFYNNLVEIFEDEIKGQQLKIFDYK